jgi:sulfur carrier protein
MQCSIGDKYLATLYYSAVMEITVNGSTTVFEAPLAVAELLRGMALAGKKVAVERNGEIVPRGAHGATLLADGDRLEIVVAVGGG